jgi:hypothetical protein
MVPTVGLPPAVPFTSQFTAVFVAFATVAMNWSMPPACTLAIAGESETVTCGGETTDIPVPLFPQLERKMGSEMARLERIATLFRFMTRPLCLSIEFACSGNSGSSTGKTAKLTTAPRPIDGPSHGSSPSSSRLLTCYPRPVRTSTVAYIQLHIIRRIFASPARITIDFKRLLFSI